METRASYVTVGAFVVICIAGLFTAMLWVAGAQYREEYTYYRTYFTGPVTGLGKGTVVRYNGIDAGNVADLAFDQTDPKLVIVTLQIDPTLRLHVDSVTSIESQGLTGVSYVEIAGGTAGAPVLEREPGEDYPVIPSKPSTLQQLAQSGPELVANLNVAGQRFGDLVNDENRKAFADTLDHLRATSALIDRHSQDIDATLANLRTITSGVTKTLDNVDRTLGTADHALASAEHALSSVDTAVGSLNGAIGSADSTVQKLGHLSDDADKLVTGQGISQMTQLVAQTRALVASLTKLTSDLEREPTRLLFGDQRQGYTPK
jgi:phospholipid/cholesterol/gamma-HCH transport system substrate-binding protein